MDKYLIKNIINFFFKKEKEKIYFQKYLKDGKNSKVLKFVNKKKQYAIKVYKDLNRLRREKLFYVFLKKNNINSVSKLLYLNEKLKIIIFDFIPGNKIKKISNSDIKKLLIFLNLLNKKKRFSLPLAIDGIKNRKDHITLCQNKINDLKFINHTFLGSNKLKNFIKLKLTPKFDYLKKKSNDKILNKYFRKLSKKELIVSPSDIGFHNIIKSNQKLFFIDFEYAGLDDPLKMLCDFLAQPNQKINFLQKKKFINNKLFSEEKILNLETLINLFLPFHKIKWCCIMLNDIKLLSKRKLNLGFQEKVYINKQIDKSINYFNRNFN